MTGEKEGMREIHKFENAKKRFLEEINKKAFFLIL